MQTSRPNIIVIYTDDQRWDALGVVQKEQGSKGRFPWFKTPNLDKLAAEGTRFRNAFVVNSLCAPSRATLLTGQYGHTNGIVDNHTPFSEKNVTVATLLSSAGYKTGYVGKWHMGNQRERPCFDFAASFIGQGKYDDCQFVVNGKDTPTKGWIDDVSTDYALQFMRESAGKPFFLVLGFKSAHGPFSPPPSHANDYTSDTARPVPNLGMSPIYASERKGNADPNALNRGYFRCLSAMDDCVGKLMASVDDNTVVIFASDNGFYLGEHSLGDKRTAYDESLRIPLLVHLPKRMRRAQKLDAMALNVDIAPTVLELAGVPVPKAMHGRSLVPLLTGKKPADWRKAFFYTYFFERGFAAPTTQCVRTENAKLIQYPGHPEWTEVFDLKADPFEIKNLARDPGAAGLRMALEQEFERQRKEIGFEIPAFADKPVATDSAPGGLVAPLNRWVLDWKEARKFDGTKLVTIASMPALRPNVGAWAIEATLTAEKPEGVILARGGVSFGYSLHLENGKPVFTVSSGGKRSQITGSESIVGRSVVLLARITPDKRLTLALDGKEIAAGPLHTFITSDPANPMELGGDAGSKVAGKDLPNFIGTLTRVRLYSGELKTS
ncbi:sulfatase-like hydrolase/transferase [Armatimonas sp.]|uniref:sulfatase-like hydrolase/transferase n=1 Tax=Armatimonas sp. TaxID=1872638 RepID=UPI00286C2E43|nr:sulfatase-like hydrolase/transferase [Armatimonas sp.]